MTASDHLDPASAMGDELGEQRILFVGREAIARRVRDDRQAAGVADPGDRIAQGGPAMRHEAGLALGQEFAEHLAGVLAHAGFDQETGKVGAGDQLRVPDEPERSLVGVADAHLGQPVGHFLGPLAAPATGARQALAQSGMVCIESQAHDVHRLSGKAHRDFGAGEVFHAFGLGRSHRAVLSADLIVVGQRPQLDAVGPRAGCQRFGGEGAV
jgi:hypothetical protein